MSKFIVNPGQRVGIGGAEYEAGEVFETDPAVVASFPPGVASPVSDDAEVSHPAQSAQDPSAPEGGDGGTEFAPSGFETSDAEAPTVSTSGSTGSKGSSK